METTDAELIDVLNPFYRALMKSNAREKDEISNETTELNLLADWLRNQLTRVQRGSAPSRMIGSGDGKEIPSVEFGRA